MAIPLVQKRFMSNSWQQFAYKLSGFNKYGLWRDDLLNDQFDPAVGEALKRLPTKLVEERNYRIIRAVQLSIRKEVLPKDEWTQLEDDILYLTPYVDDVIREVKEQEEWSKKY